MKRDIEKRQSEVPATTDAEQVPTAGLTEALGGVAATGAVVTMALFPFALPAIVLALVALAPLLVVTAVLGLLFAAGVVTFRLIQGLSHQTMRFFRRLGESGHWPHPMH